MSTQKERTETKETTTVVEKSTPTPDPKAKVEKTVEKTTTTVEPTVDPNGAPVDGTINL